ncbi:MAG: DNA-binding protein, partial [Thermoproteota archaeon]
MSDPKKSKDAEDILSEFHDTDVLSEPQLSPPESEPQLSPPESEPQLSPPASEHSTETKHDLEERDVIFVGTKPILTYVAATLTQLSTR